MTKDEALKMALEALEDVQDMMTTSDWFNDRVQAVRQALDQLPDTTKMIDTGTDRGAWSDVPNATKWVDDLRGGDEWTPDDMAYRPNGLSLEESPTDAQIIAGAIFDFAGFLTTRDKVIKVGSTANTAHVADLVKEWADMRKLSLDDAAVSWWQDVLEESPNSTKPVVEAKPVGYVYQNELEGMALGHYPTTEIFLTKAIGSIPLYTTPPNSTTSAVEPIGEIVEAHGLIAVSIPEMPPAGTKLYTAPKREWQWLTYRELQEIMDSMKTLNSFDITDIYTAVEAKLKEKNT